MKKLIHSFCLLSAVSFLGTASLTAADTMSSSSSSTATVNCENFSEADENAEIVPGQGFTKGDIKKGNFKYDVNNVLTVRGTVVKVVRVNRDGKCRVFVILRTDNGRAIVKLRSLPFIERNNIVLNEGDQIQIKGAQSTVNGRIFIVAKEITTKDGNTISLRDDQGNTIGDSDDDGSSTSTFKSDSYSFTQKRNTPSAIDRSDSPRTDRFSTTSPYDTSRRSSTDLNRTDSTRGIQTDRYSSTDTRRSIDNRSIPTDRYSSTDTRRSTSTENVRSSSSY